MCLRPYQLTKDKALGDLLCFSRLQKHVHFWKRDTLPDTQHSKWRPGPSFLVQLLPAFQD